MFTTRRLTPEHMDDPLATRDEQATALRFLRRVNARLGGARAAIMHLKRWTESSRALAPTSGPIRILDVGSGSADIPVAIVHWARRAGLAMHITAVDLHPVTVDLARAFVRESGADNSISVVQGDALRLTEMFQPESFDFAHAGLFLHHLPDIEVMTVLRMMDRLSRRGMIWNDLVRMPLPRVMLFPLLIGAPPKLKHDAVVSVQAGFKRAEAIDLATRAGWRDPRWRRHIVHRFTLTSHKPGS